MPHAKRFNHIIIEKRRDDKSESGFLRGCYSSKVKADNAFLTLRDAEYRRLEGFYCTTPARNDSTNRCVLTVPGHTTTLIIIKVPQDVIIADQIA